jgi:hypothetical protein
MLIANFQVVLGCVVVGEVEKNGLKKQFSWELEDSFLNSSFWLMTNFEGVQMVIV